MPIERYFSNAQLLQGTSITIEGQEFHHLVHVMRSKKDDSIELIDGKGSLAIAKIRSIDKKQAVVEILNLQTQPQPKLKLILLQAMPRLNRLEFILEKCTELGMTDLWLFPGERSEKIHFSTNQTERLYSILIASIKQCGRLFIPELHFKPALKQWKECTQPVYFGDLRPEAPSLLSQWQNEKRRECVCFCVGPESGFSEAEIEQLKKLGAVGVKLNQNILRTDTAAIAAISVLSQLFFS